MRSAVIILLVVAMMVNTAGIIALLMNGSEDGKGPDKTGPDELVPSTITKLQVPEPRIGDLIRYDYTVFAQLYSENYTSGEWERYTLTGKGELLQDVRPLTSVEDGFTVTRRSLENSYDTRATFNVKIEGSERDELNVPGSLELKRSEFRNLFDKHILNAYNSGHIQVDNLGTAFGSLPASVEYDATLRTYPDPMDEPIPTIDETIYGGSRPLDLQSRGAYLGDPVYGEADRVYNWSVEGAYAFMDHDTFMVNVTSDIWGFLFYHRTFLISADSPFPLKGRTRTNTSAYWDDGEFYLEFVTETKLKDVFGSLKNGDAAIPWGDATGHKEYILTHPGGQFEDWDYAPSDGSDLSTSSFSGLTLNGAIDHVVARSGGLKDFLSEYEKKGRVIIEESVWNRSTEGIINKNTTTWWNLTFAYIYDMKEMEDYYTANDDWPEWRYRVLVATSVEEGPRGEKEISTFISKDDGDPYHGRRKVYWGDGVHKENLQLASNLLTLTHAEKILRSDSEVRSECYQGNYLTDDTVFFYGVVGVNEGNNPALTLISQITGITTPTADNAFGLQKENVWETGGTFSAATDANAGRLLYVTKVEGSQLAAIFGG
ncbi:MAG: hypothetical protein MUC62_05985 [Candidatus Thermoplasmatota archaeon]|jgi:hypothetical protein|nr:hypothetical protein [Candidatus Thermoplasmatota archaeon]